MHMQVVRTCLKRCRRGSSTSSGFSAVPLIALLAPDALLSEWARLRLCCRDFRCSVLWSRSNASCHSAHKLLSLCARFTHANFQQDGSVRRV